MRLFHEGAKQPDLVWKSGPGQFDWNRAKIAASGDTAYILYDYGSADTGLFVFHTGVKQPDCVWKSGPGQFDWNRAKIAASGDTAYILYDNTNVNTSLFVYHAGAKQPDLVWISGPGQFDWSRAKIAASGETAYFLYDYGDSRTTLFAFHADAKQPDLIWGNGPGHFDWNRAKIAASGDTNQPWASSAQPDWKKDARWCTTDDGNSAIDYRNWRSGGNDQFDSVLACQEHNGLARQAVRAAGREAVNDFLGSIFPPPKPDLSKPEWQIHARWCVTDHCPSPLFSLPVTG